MSSTHLLIYSFIHPRTYMSTPTHAHPFTQRAITGPPLAFQHIRPLHYLLGIFWGNRIWEACVWKDDCRVLCGVLLWSPWGMLRLMMLDVKSRMRVFGSKSRWTAGMCSSCLDLCAWWVWQQSITQSIDKVLWFWQGVKQRCNTN